MYRAGELVERGISQSQGSFDMTEKIIVISTTEGRRNPMYSPVLELKMGYLSR